MPENPHMGLEEFFAGNYDYIRRLVFHFRKKHASWMDNGACEDVIQAVCLRFMEYALARFRGESKLTTYVFRVTHNVFFDHLRVLIRDRDRKDRSLQNMPEYIPDTRDAIGGVLDEENPPAPREQVEELLSGMSPLKQTIGKMFFLDGVKQEDIAEMLGKAQSTVSEHVGTIRRYLRDELRRKDKEHVLEHER